MIPDPITWGHVLMLAGILVGLYGLWQAVIWAQHRPFVRGTPQYARGRDGRRFAIRAFIVAIILFAIGCFSPLCEMPIA